MPETENSRFYLLKTKIKKYFKFIDYIIKIFLILILLFLLLELFSYVVYSFHQGAYPSPYSDKQFSKEYTKEYTESNQFYFVPYVIYKRLPDYHSKYINLNNESLRLTTNHNLTNPIKIFVFGGSTTWGDGVIDNETMPSYLSDYFYNKNISVEVFNFGESGYTNTQEMINLELELRKGNIPDIVIFYDGINEVIAAYQSSAGMPQNLLDREKDYGSRNKINLINCLTNSYFSKIVRSIYIRIRGPVESSVELKEDKAEEILNVYFNNIKIIKALEKEYNFKGFYYWQPGLSTKNIKSEYEKRVIKFWENSDKPTLDLFNITTEKMHNENVSNIADIFENINKSIFLDEWHVSAEGNSMVAERIGEDVIKYISNEH